MNLPNLDPPFDDALEQALTFIRARTEPLGVLACGSITRGEGDASSDLDLYVVHAAPWRQRIQKRFAGVPAEIFVNPPGQIRRYMADEEESGRLITAHMLATGHVLFEDDKIVPALRLDARDRLAKVPALDPESLALKRYLAACRCEDATDRRQTDPVAARRLMNRAVDAMLEYSLWNSGRWQPRDKDLLDVLDDDVAALARLWLDDGDWDAALELADKTIGTCGFFEWEWPRESVGG